MEYYHRINGLRAIAVILVLIEHFGGIISRKIPFGQYGVDLFFVISGFLITSILLNNPGTSIWKGYKKFLGRRALRIFPIYYFTILILWCANLPIVREKLFYFLTYTYNYAWVYFNIPETPVNHFWSLCVEEQFYVFWPIIVLLLRDNLKILVMVISIFIFFGYSQLYFNLIPDISAYNKVSLLTKFTALGLGALGGIFSLKYSLPKIISNNKSLEYLIPLLVVFSLHFQFRYSSLILSISSLYMVLKCSKYSFVNKKINDLLSSNLLTFIGSISYGIYIFHLPLAYYLSMYVFDPLLLQLGKNSNSFVRFVIEQQWVIKLPLYSIISIFIAYISYQLIEKPFLNLKDKYFN